MPELVGAIVVDKPAGWTSHDVVNKMRRIAGTRKVGHLGTLDPLATGVLPVLINGATRLARFFTNNDKIYEGTVQFGYSTKSYDADGEPTSEPVHVTFDRVTLKTALQAFQGEVWQTPPAVSAKKIAGRPAYELARKSLPVELAPVKVQIHSIELREIDGNTASIRVHCGSGTYIRSIAHDWGQALGCGAFLKTLRRMASGTFAIEQAHTLDQLAVLAAEQRLEEALIPASNLLPEIPSEVVDDVTVAQIRNGRDFRVSPFIIRPDARFVKAMTKEGQLVAVGEARLPHIYHPILVI